MRAVDHLLNGGTNVIEVLLAEAADTGGDSSAGLGFILFMVFAYFIPTIVAVSRGVRNKGSVIAVNVFLGWTFIGWVVALAMALRTVDRQPLPGLQQPPLQ